MFAGTGTLLVDDVTLLPGIHEEVAASEMPPQKGNRIYNSGFEAGPEGWTPTDGFVVDRTTAHSGRCSARLGTVDLPSVTLPLNRPLAPATRPRTAPPGIECRPFPVRAGHALHAQRVDQGRRAEHARDAAVLRVGRRRRRPAVRTATSARPA